MRYEVPFTINKRVFANYKRYSRVTHMIFRPINFQCSLVSSWNKTEIL